eukprot:jgi/Chrpa1/8395/Chrysochromulina_OHIO_Genome00003703-RA
MHAVDAIARFDWPAKVEGHKINKTGEGKCEEQRSGEVAPREASRKGEGGCSLREHIEDETGGQ